MSRKSQKPRELSVMFLLVSCLKRTQMSDPAMILDDLYHELADDELLIVHFETVVEADRLRRTDDRLLDELESPSADARC